jgi:hypothetical protein
MKFGGIAYEDSPLLSVRYPTLSSNFAQAFQASERF